MCRYSHPPRYSHLVGPRRERCVKHLRKPPVIHPMEMRQVYSRSGRALRRRRDCRDWGDRVGDTRGGGDWSGQTELRENPLSSWRVRGFHAKPPRIFHKGGGYFRKWICAPQRTYQTSEGQRRWSSCRTNSGLPTRKLTRVVKVQTSLFTRALSIHTREPDQPLT